jgi:hypothetical protein
MTNSTRQGRQQRTGRECRSVCGVKQDKNVSAGEEELRSKILTGNVNRSVGIGQDV